MGQNWTLLFSEGVVPKELHPKAILNIEETVISDGKPIYLLVNKEPLVNEDNEIIGILGISIDITDRKKMETKLLQAKKARVQSYYENIICGLPCYVYWKDKNFVYLGCNDLAARWLHLPSRQTIVGMTDYDFGWETTVVDSYRAIDEEIISKGKAILNIEETVIIDGKQISLLVNKEPLLNEENEIIGILGISIDITERKKMEEQLQQAILAADAANRAKGEFLRNMEHQLRTPFSGVYSLVSVAADQESNPEIKELLDITYRSGEELLSLINDIIDFSRNEVDSSIVLDKKFDLKQLIEKTVILEKPAAIAKQLELSYNYPEELPTVFVSDPKRIQGILLHLLSNSIKFTPNGRVIIDVKLGKRVDENNYILQILVTDTGIGISEENQAFIYERFYRVSPANQNKYPGAGLGLSTVRRLIEDLHGEIDVVSKLGQGTTLICTFLLKRPLLDELISEETNAKKYYLFLQKDK